MWRMVDTTSRNEVEGKAVNRQPADSLRYCQEHMQELEVCQSDTNWPRTNAKLAPHQFHY